MKFIYYHYDFIVFSIVNGYLWIAFYFNIWLYRRQPGLGGNVIIINEIIFSHSPLPLTTPRFILVGSHYNRLFSLVHFWKSSGNKVFPRKRRSSSYITAENPVRKNSWALNFDSSKMKSSNFQVFAHTDMTSLHSHVTADVLPPEYGGTYPVTMDELRGNR